MKNMPKRKNPMIIVAASGLLSITLGATNAYAVSEVTPEMTDVDVNAKAEQYDIVETKGAVAALTKYDVNETKFLKNNGIVKWTPLSRQYFIKIKRVSIPLQQIGAVPLLLLKKPVYH